MDYNDFTALETDTLVDVGLVQPEGEQEEQPAQETETHTDNNEQGEDQAEQTNTESETSTEVPTLNLDGIGEVKLDDIKEWQKGYLRQSDYTRKTQELAKQREEVATAVEVFDYLRNNPNLVSQLKQLDTEGTMNTGVMNQTTPEAGMLKQLWYNQKSMEIDHQVDKLKRQYGDIDEVALFNKAAELKTDNLEYAYKIIAFDNKPLNEKDLVERAKSELRNELEQSKNATKTIVSSNSTQMQSQQTALSSAEKRVALGMGLTESEYSKWKNK